MSQLGVHYRPNGNGSTRLVLSLAAVGDRELDDDELAALMAEAFGASREFLARTTLLPSNAVADHSLGLSQLHQTERVADSLNRGGAISRR